MRGPGSGLRGSVIAVDGSWEMSRMHTGTSSDLNFCAQDSGPCCSHHKAENKGAAHTSCSSEESIPGCACAGFNKITVPYLLQFRAVIIPLQSMLKMATVPTVSPALCGMWFYFPDLTEIVS